MKWSLIWDEMVSKFLSKYYSYSKAMQLRKDILNFQELPTELVFEAWERFKSCLRKCPDHRNLHNDQILTFYQGITMINRDKIMMVAGGNIMRKTPQEAYDLIENMTQHHYHPTPSSDSIIASPSPSLTPLENSDFLLEETDAFLALDSIPPGIDNEIFDAEGHILFLENLLNIDSIKDLPPQELNNDFKGHILFLEKLLNDEPSEAKNSEINSLIMGPSDTFLMGDKEIKFNPLKDIDNPVSFPRVSEKPLDSLDP
ncbi:reverse transcriptase domain-containing protein [Tanacetum coccineum]